MFGKILLKELVALSKHNAVFSAWMESNSLRLLAYIKAAFDKHLYTSFLTYVKHSPYLAPRQKVLVIFGHFTINTCSDRTNLHKDYLMHCALCFDTVIRYLL